MAFTTRKKKKLIVYARSRSTTPGVGSKTTQRPSGQLAGKHNTNLLANSRDSSKPANRRPAPDAERAQMSAISTGATCELAAIRSGTPGPQRG